MEEFPCLKTRQGERSVKLFGKVLQFEDYQKEIVANEAKRVGITSTGIAVYLGINVNTVRQWKARFEKNGFLKSVGRPRNHTCPLSAGYEPKAATENPQQQMINNSTSDNPTTIDKSRKRTTVGEEALHIRDKERVSVQTK